MDVPHGRTGSVRIHRSSSDENAGSDFHSDEEDGSGEEVLFHYGQSPPHGSRFQKHMSKNKKISRNRRDSKGRPGKQSRSNAFGQRAMGLTSITSTLSPEDKRVGASDSRGTGMQRRKERDEKLAERSPSQELVLVDSVVGERQLSRSDSQVSDRFLLRLTSNVSDASAGSDGGSERTSPRHSSGGATGLSVPGASPTPLSPVKDRSEFYQYVVGVVRGLSLTESARFCHGTRRALSANPTVTAAATASERAAAERLWLELQSHLVERSVSSHQDELRRARAHLEPLLCHVEQFCWNRDAGGNLVHVCHAKDDRAAASLPMRQAIAAVGVDDCGIPTLPFAELHCFSGEHVRVRRCLTGLLQELSRAAALYPSKQSFAIEHSRITSQAFTCRLNVLNVWQNTASQLGCLLTTLRRWTDVNVDVLQLARVESHAAMMLGSLSALRIPASDLKVYKASQQSDGSSPAMIPRRCLSSPVQGSPPVFLLNDLTRSASEESASAPDECDDSWNDIVSTDDDDISKRYRPFVDKALKRWGLVSLVERLMNMVDSVLRQTQSLFLTQTEHSLVNSSPSSREASSNTPASHKSSPSLGSTLSDVSYMSSRGTPSSASPKSALTAPELNRVRGAAVSRAARAHWLFPSDVGTWEKEFEAIGLPSFVRPFLTLLRLPIDVVHEVVKLRLEHRPSGEPSALSIKQLLLESKETLVAVHDVKAYYLQLIEVILPHMDDKTRERLEASHTVFERDMKHVIEVYLDDLHQYIQLLSRLEHASFGLKNVLEDEWQFIRRVVPEVRSGEAQVGWRFCAMAQNFLESTLNFLESGLDCCTSELHSCMCTCVDGRRQCLLNTYRLYRELFIEARERSSRALGFARILHKDLEIAADFKLECDESALLEQLKNLDYAMVVVPNYSHRTAGVPKLFVPGKIKKNTKQILQLLNISCGREGRSNTLTGVDEGYLLLLSNVSPSDTRVLNSSPSGSPPKASPSTDSLLRTNSELSSSSSSHSLLLNWEGDIVEVQPSIESAYALADLQVDQLKLVVSHSDLLQRERQRFQHSMRGFLKLDKEQTASHHNVADCLKDLRDASLKLGEGFVAAVKSVDSQLQIDAPEELDEEGHTVLRNSYVKTMQRCYTTTFEYVREASRRAPGDYRVIGDHLVKFARRWMEFVRENCSNNHSIRPRWVAEGLEFLLVVCDPSYLSDIPEVVYQEFCREVISCLSHFSASPDVKQEASRSPWKSSAGDRAPLAKRGKSKSLHKKSRSHGSKVLHRWPTAPEGNMFDGSNFPKPHRRSAPSSGPDTPPEVFSSALVYDRSRSNSVPVGGLLSSNGMLPPVVGSPSDSSLLELVKKGLQSEADDVTSAGSASTTGTSTPQLVEGTASLSKTEGTMAAVPRLPKLQRCRESLEVIETQRQQGLRLCGMIGQEVTGHVGMSSEESAIRAKLKQVRFGWQRGNRIGAGRFGQVYSCVNLESGDLMAVKEVLLRGASSGTIREIADEIQIMEGLKHPHLVQYYGTEMHKEEMLIFMEYCSGGTLYSQARQGPPESLIRLWTRQLVEAVRELHAHGIVHGDIKGANVFLSENGDVKLGDFGSSAKLANADTTIDGELVDVRGTAAYMAPEVITSNKGRGFGRAADIWSLGCVVVELVTGKRPWSDLDHEYTIMFRVGDGHTPPVPETLGSEGHKFLSRCFAFQPQDRATASELLDHSFVKVGAGD